MEQFAHDWVPASIWVDHFELHCVLLSWGGCGRMMVFRSVSSSERWIVDHFPLPNWLPSNSNVATGNGFPPNLGFPAKSELWLERIGGFVKFDDKFGHGSEKWNRNSTAIFRNSPTIFRNSAQFSKSRSFDLIWSVRTHKMLRFSENVGLKLEIAPIFGKFWFETWNCPDFRKIMVRNLNLYGFCLIRSVQDRSI